MKCFAIIPHQDSFREVYRVAISPAAKECGLECSRAEEEFFTGHVIAKIKDLIAESQLCVADITGANANVMFEIAMALSLHKPVMFITQGEFSDVPFDVRDHRVVRYVHSEQGLLELKGNITKTIQTTLRLGGSPMYPLRQMLVPASLSRQDGPYVVAASPLSYREAFRIGGGWLERPVGTFSDQVGIRGLMQAFGSIYAFNRLPELLDPDDFDDKVLSTPMHLYCIGSPKANRWTGMMMKKFFESRSSSWEFRPDPESLELRNPKVLIYREGRPYEPVHSVPGGRLVWDFGLVIRGPHPNDSSRLFMALAGRSSLGTEAACLAATDPSCVEKLGAALQAERVNLDDHTQAFCAVVSISAKERKARLGGDPAQFRVEGIRTY
jgi:hypothetical protein